MALDPANAQAWRWRAHLHREVDTAAAVEHATHAIALAPENATQIRRSRAIWLTRLERYAEAIADCDMLLDLEPANDDLHVARAFVMEKSGISKERLPATCRPLRSRRTTSIAP